MEDFKTDCPLFAPGQSWDSLNITEQQWAILSAPDLDYIIPPALYSSAVSKVYSLVFSLQEMRE